MGDSAAVAEEVIASAAAAAIASAADHTAAGVSAHGLTTVTEAGRSAIEASAARLSAADMADILAARIAELTAGVRIAADMVGVTGPITTAGTFLLALDLDPCSDGQGTFTILTCMITRVTIMSILITHTIIPATRTAIRRTIMGRLTSTVQGSVLPQAEQWYVAM